MKTSKPMFKQTLSKVAGTVDHSLLEQMETAAKSRMERQRLPPSLCITTVMRRIEGNVIYVCPCLHYVKSQNNIVKLQQVLLSAKASGKYMVY